MNGQNSSPSLVRGGGPFGRHLFRLATAARDVVRNFVLFRILYRGVKVGEQVKCAWSAYFYPAIGPISLGNRVGIGRYCCFQAKVRIGNSVLIASEVAFINSDDHRYDVIGRTMWDSGRGDAHEIVVEDDVWIGYGAIVMAPAHIGTGSIVAAGSVVKGRVEPYSIVGGVPAKLIRRRFTQEEAEQHEAIIKENKH